MKLICCFGDPRHTTGEVLYFRVFRGDRFNGLFFGLTGMRKDQLHIGVGADPNLTKWLDVGPAQDVELPLFWLDRI